MLRTAKNANVATTSAHISVVSLILKGSSLQKEGIRKTLPSLGTLFKRLIPNTAGQSSMVWNTKPCPVPYHRPAPCLRAVGLQNKTFFSALMLFLPDISVGFDWYTTLTGCEGPIS